MYPIGDQRVGIEWNTPVLDGSGNPTYTEANEPIVATTTLWVDHAAFEIQTPSEQQNLTVTTSEIGWAFLPVSADRVIPAVDADGNPAPLPFFGTGGKPSIDANARLVHNGLRYVMRGDAVLEQDIRGRADHIFCLCERQNT